MATGDLKIDEGSTTNLPTYTITEDAETKEIPRSAIVDSSGAEKGVAANPTVMSGVVNGSVNAVIPTAQIATLTPPAAITGYALEAGNLATLTAKDFATQTTLALIKAKTDNIDVALSTRTKPADVQTISGTVGGTVVAVVSNFPAVTTSGVQHTVVDNFPPVQQTFQANIAQENGGKLESINSKTPALGQATMSASQPVAVASDQSPYPVYRNTTTYSGSTHVPSFRTFANVAASQTDSSIVPAISGKIIRVTAFMAQAGGTATNVTFNSKGGGAGTAISMTFQNGINAGEVGPENLAGWFQTNASEGLTVTTGAGSTTGIQVTYVLI